jgi:uncharacterized secreted protein with C-terminal beta-propeller domain
VRLHFERLEDRLFMNGDDPLIAAENLATSTTSFEALSLDSAAMVATTAASISTSATESTLTMPERFQSLAEFEEWLIDAAIAEYGRLFGQPTYSYGRYDYGWYRGDVLLMGQPLIMPFAMAAVTNDAAVAFSSTNVQVDGVDEADLVETDGEYLYIISGHDLVIVRAGVGDELRDVSRVHLDERPIGMYLSGDRLALVSSSQGQWKPWAGSILSGPDEWHYEPPTTTVTVLDIADRAAPAVVQKTAMDGQLVTTRVVDGQLRLVLSNQFQLPSPLIKPVATARPADDLVASPVLLDRVMTTGSLLAESDWWPGGSNSECVYETQEEYLARVRDEILGAIRPRVRTLDVDGNVVADKQLVEPTDIYRPDSYFERQMITIATFDLASNEAGPVETTSVMAGSAPQVYSTANNVYVFTQKAWNWQNWDSTSVSQTTVWKFDLDLQTHAIELEARGKFDGTLLNQFSADEHEGYLRVVTSSNSWGSGGHSLHVLEQVGSHLKVVGSVGGIAPNDVLYSVRFMGERAFFVTFQKVDPLFAVDLSDPEDPKLLGELHIPGYSDYLQPIDENHLVAIGRGADESTGLFQELQVSIFDVSDLSDPRLLHRYSFAGGRSTATPATGGRWARGDGDHHAVSYFADEQILAIPIYTVDDFGGFWGGVENTGIFEARQGGLQVFKIDVGAGFTPIGLVEHETLIERSIQIGEHLFAVSSGKVSVHELTDPSIQLGEVSIATDSNDPATKPVEFVPPVQLVIADVPADKPVEPPVTKPIDEIQELDVSTSEGETPLPIEPPGVVEPVDTPIVIVCDFPNSKVESDRRLDEGESRHVVQHANVSAIAGDKRADETGGNLPDSGAEATTAMQSHSLPDVNQRHDIVSVESESKHQALPIDGHQTSAPTPDRRLGKARAGLRLAHKLTSLARDR